MGKEIVRRQLVVATKNKGKAEEFNAMLYREGFNIDVLSLLDLPHLPEVIETGSSFKENAYIKAKEICERTHLPVLADDSGLEVDWLGGVPGIYSARFAGEPKSDQRNNSKLLESLRGVPMEKRTARFRCSICIMHPSGDRYETEGVCEGVIVEQPIGEQGFGYDPLFYLPQHKKTMAQLSPEEKNTLSHRAVAFRKAIDILRKIL